MAPWPVLGPCTSRFTGSALHYFSVVGLCHPPVSLTYTNITVAEQKDYCYDIPVKDTLARLLQNDSRAWEQVKATQEEWSRNPPARGTKATVIADITDGSVFRDHPEFGQNARLGKAGEPFQLAIGLYYDGIETANPLGYARGKHSIGCIYMSLINLDKSIRMSRPYIMPVTIVLEQDMRHYGATLVLSGANKETGDVLPGHESSFGAQMRLLHQPNGVEWEVPSEMGGLRKQAFRAHLLVVSADFPACGKLTPFAESTSANQPSRAFDWDQTKKDAFKPFSFLRKTDPRGQRIVTPWKLRTLVQVSADIQSATSKEDLKRCGLQKSVYALDPKLVPHADCTTMCPNDPMHGEPDGNLRRSGYRTLYMMIKHKWCTVEALNARMHEYEWPTGQRPPDLHESIKEGVKGGMPSPDGKWRYSAAQGLYFAKHSVALLRPFIQDEDAPFWKCWVKHVEYVNVLLQDEFTHGDILALDRLIFEYQVAVAEVYPGYKKPKDIFSFQYPVDILRNGPPRCYWCMPFESFNQVCKRIAEASNYKQICKRVLEVWSLRSARHLISGRVTDWGATCPTYFHTDKPVVVSRRHCDELVGRLFGAFCPADTALEFVEISSVHHLGGDFEAGYTWIIHETLEARLAPALARVERLFEVTYGARSFIFVQVLRYPSISLETRAGSASGIQVSGDDIESAEAEDELLYLPSQLMTMLHHTQAVGSHFFLYV